MSTTARVSKVVSPVGRLSFPDLWKPKAFIDKEGKAGPAKYNATLLFPPDADLSGLKANAAEALRGKFGKEFTLKHCRGDKNPFHECAEKPDLSGYEDGWHYVKFSSKNPVAICRKRNGKIVPITEDEGILFAGCWVKVSASAYAFDYLGKGVAFGLSSVLLVKSGEPFGASASPEDEFADVEDEYEDVEVSDEIDETDEVF